MKTLPSLAFAALVASLFGCSHLPPEKRETLVLIQGVHLDGSSWDKFTRALPVGHFNIMDFDRAGRDTDTPASLHDIAALGCRAINGRATVVAHSYGGAIANAMVGICADKIAKIIYVSAVVPLNGEKPFDQLPADNQKIYSGAVSFRKPRIVPKDPKIFFAALDHEVDLNGKLPKLYAEWMSLTAEVLSFDRGRFDAIPKAYIYTSNDPVITLSTQQNYVMRTKIAMTESVPTGHFPMVSDPTALAAAVAKLAQTSNP